MRSGLAPSAVSASKFQLGAPHTSALTRQGCRARAETSSAGRLATSQAGPGLVATFKESTASLLCRPNTKYKQE